MYDADPTGCGVVMGPDGGAESSNKRRSGFALAGGDHYNPFIYLRQDSLVHVAGRRKWGGGEVGKKGGRGREGGKRKVREQ